MKRKVRIGFRVWNKNMTPEIFFRRMPYILDAFDFVQDQRDPDYWIFNRRRPTSGVRIYYNFESTGIDIDMNSCEWAFGCAYNRDVGHDHYFRQPNYVRLGAGRDLIKPEDYSAEDILERKRKFCAFVYFNRVPERNRIFSALSKYKKVDAPGKACHNCSPIGGFASPNLDRRTAGMYDRKLAYLQDYKFVIAFENTSVPGYTTEKLYHAMRSDSIGIYWGNPLIGREFNERSFVSAHEDPTDNMSQMLDRLVTRIIALDKDDDLYLSALREPWLPNNQLTKYTDEAQILGQFTRIFA